MRRTAGEGPFRSVGPGRSAPRGNRASLAGLDEASCRAMTSQANTAARIATSPAFGLDGFFFGWGFWGFYWSSGAGRRAGS